ncbi:F0F1 ATP synthase subunit delta [Salinicoccus jeotgali]|uniref:ATP synthase subunit delta n=1 Tax=Salinicoccus jeotgali TaxID=381634 RepID=A0ABP7EAD3_9STAP
MSSSAQKYSEALFNAVEESGQLEAARRDFDEVMKAFKNTPLFTKFAENPRIPMNKKREVLKEAFNDIVEPLRNALLILSDRNKLTEVTSVYNSFIDRYNRHHNQENVVIESVYELSSEEIESIGKVFVKRTGLSKLLIENKVNEELVGGIRVFIGTKVYDGSLNTKLSDLRSKLRESTNS